LTEGLPNTLLEAMAMEVPVVATGVGGVPELIEDGKTGVLCNVGDIDGITSVVLGLMADSGKREEFAVNGRARIVEKFSFNKRLEIIEDYYWGLARDS
jgi:glycosyltransferase involved in cell wall biosynthesis